MSSLVSVEVQLDLGSTGADDARVLVSWFGYEETIYGLLNDQASMVAALVSRTLEACPPKTEGDFDRVISSVELAVEAGWLPALTSSFDEWGKEVTSD